MRAFFLSVRLMVTYREKIKCGLDLKNKWDAAKDVEGTL
jgi:hypothetical protein